MRVKATEDLIQESKQKNKEEIYWDEFLGNYAGKNRGEDRLFATSLAINAIIDIWTYNRNQSDRSRSWIKNTPN